MSAQKIFSPPAGFVPRTECKFGENCIREICWFKHSNSRIIDNPVAPITPEIMKMQIKILQMQLQMAVLQAPVQAPVQAPAKKKISLDEKIVNDEIASVAEAGTDVLIEVSPSGETLIRMMSNAMKCTLYKNGAMNINKTRKLKWHGEHERLASLFDAMCAKAKPVVEEPVVAKPIVVAEEATKVDKRWTIPCKHGLTCHGFKNGKCQYNHPELTIDDVHRQFGEVVHKIVELAIPTSPSDHGKITGMLLELPIGDIKSLCVTPPLMMSKINEAVEILRVSRLEEEKAHMRFGAFTCDQSGKVVLSIGEASQ